MKKQLLLLFILLLISCFIIIGFTSCSDGDSDDDDSDRPEITVATDTTEIMVGDTSDVGVQAINTTTASPLSVI